jgi:transposase
VIKSFQSIVITERKSPSPCLAPAITPITQSLPDWIASHVRAFAYFGGAARQTISDNLKAGVTRACFHEPMVNRTYADLSRHYGTVISPGRPYHPKDKSKVEVGVQIVGRWILAVEEPPLLRLAALNEAIRSLLG